MSKALAIVDNNVVSLEEAKINLDDNGYLLGDGVFETMRTKHDGSLFRPELHLARASHGLKKLLINTDISEIFMAIAEKLRSKAVEQIGNDLYIRINISSGSKQDWSTNPKLKITGIAKPLPQPKTNKLACVTWNEFTEKHALSDVKSLSYARSSALRRKVNSIDADDVILVNSDGNVVEASVSNVIARKGNIVFAPSTESGALPGTTRDIVINELLGEKYDVEEYLALERLLQCDEVMLTSSISGVVRVVKINNSEYQVSELFDELSQKYEALLA